MKPQHPGFVSFADKPSAQFPALKDDDVVTYVISGPTADDCEQGLAVINEDGTKLTRLTTSTPEDRL